MNLVGQKVIVVRDLNKPTENSFDKGETAIITHHRPEQSRLIPFDTEVQSLDGKRRTPGNLFNPDQERSTYHFILANDKAARVLYGD